MVDLSLSVLVMIHHQVLSAKLAVLIPFVMPPFLPTGMIKMQPGRAPILPSLHPMGRHLHHPPQPAVAMQRRRYSPGSCILRMRHRRGRSRRLLSIRRLHCIITEQ